MTATATELRPLEVIPTGDRMTFHVRSQTKPLIAYTVSLLEHGGLSECTCKDWQCRCWPLVKLGTPARCKHIRIARHQFLDELLATMAQQENEPSCPA